MKKALIISIFFLMTFLSLKAQNPTVCQPDSVVFYINMAEYPFQDPIDSVGWIKFSYDENGLLTYCRKEHFSEELWYYEDHTFEYDSFHNLTKDSLRGSAYNAPYPSSLCNVYTYQNINQLSTFALYYADYHSPYGVYHWARWDTI